MNQKPKLVLIPKAALLLPILLFHVLLLHAAIPGSITSLYPVSGSESSISNVTIQANGTLSVSGNATINGTLTILPHGNLIVTGTGTLKMAPGAKIVAQGAGYSAGNGTSYVGGSMQVNGTITCSVAGSYWSGIEATGPNNFYNNSIIKIGTGSIIRNATVALRNNGGTSPNSPNVTAGGFFQVDGAVFRNNVRHIALTDELISIGSIPTSPNYPPYNFAANFSNTKFIDSTDMIPANPVDMVYLQNCLNISFIGCSFYNYSIYAIKGINAVNSGFRLQGAYPASNTITMPMIGFTTDAVITNSMQTDRANIISNMSFGANTGITASGCLKLQILGCRFVWPTANQNQYYAGIYLNNCTGYKVEGNQGYAHPLKGAPFAIVRNSGTAYNEIYRNAPTMSVLGVQSIGINRNASGSTGLKILCNNLSSDMNNGISVIKQPTFFPVGGQGVANQQYTYTTVYTPFPISAITSAGNNFAHASSGWDFYVGPNTNTIPQLYYRYTTFGSAQQPIYTNMLPSNVLTTSFNNTCPVHNIGAPPPPFPYLTFVRNNALIEDQIKQLVYASPTVDTAVDTAIAGSLDQLYFEHTQLIDSIIDYYQYMGYADTTGHNGVYPDSIALVYQQIGVGYEYQIHLASAYAAKGKYGDALSVLSLIPSHYILTNDEATYISNLKDMFNVRQWLYANSDNWDGIPGNYRDVVYQHEQDDPMFAGAMARAILVQFEGATYDPYYELPPDQMQPASLNVKLPLANKIYPNPTTGLASINWTGADNAVLKLLNVSGREVWNRNIQSGITKIDLSKLTAGTYFAEISVDGKVVYQQKMVKE